MISVKKELSNSEYLELLEIHNNYVFYQTKIDELYEIFRNKLEINSSGGAEDCCFDIFFNYYGNLKEDLEEYLNIKVIKDEKK